MYSKVFFFEFFSDLGFFGEIENIRIFSNIFKFSFKILMYLREIENSQKSAFLWQVGNIFRFSSESLDNKNFNSKFNGC